MQMMPSTSLSPAIMGDYAATVAAVAAISVCYVVKVPVGHALPYSSAGSGWDEEGAVAVTLPLSFLLWLVARCRANRRALGANFRFVPHNTLVLFGLCNQASLDGFSGAVLRRRT